MLLYYITDRTQFAGGETERKRSLLAKVAEAARSGVDYIQLREKDLSARELEALAREAVRLVHYNPSRTEDRRSKTVLLLVNSRADVALACSADGVHLHADDISVPDVRTIWSRHLVNLSAGPRTPPASSAGARPALVAVSCHSVGEVRRAAEGGADFAVFGPVFGKNTAEKKARENNPATDSPSNGLNALRQACKEKIPVLALGGVTLESAALCLEAGAAGIAAIRLFQENDILGVVEGLREVTHR